jgi:serine/threonine-protein kinase
MAYVSSESGRSQVYVQPFSGPGGKTQISNEGGQEPLWSRDGRELFYRRPNQVWVVDVQTAAGFIAGKPRLLFELKGYTLGTPLRNWDVSPDGKRFLTVKDGERKPERATEMILVQNWFEELKRLVPTGKN